MSVYRTKGERISMKKFKIKTNLVSGVIMGVAALLLIILLPSQVRVPAFDSGAPSPRIIPGICLAIMLVSSIALIIQSLVLKQEKDRGIRLGKRKARHPPHSWHVRVYRPDALHWLCAGVSDRFPLALFYVGERKPGPYIVVLVSAFAIFLLFKNVFNISLPALGLLGGSSDVGFCIDFAGYPAGVHPV